MNLNKIGWLLVIGVFGLACYAYLQRYLVFENGVKTEAFVITPIGYKIGRFEKDWKLIYIVDNKPFYASATEPDLKPGDIFELTYNKKDISKYALGEKKKTKLSSEDVLIYGDEINERINKIKILSFEKRILLEDGISRCFAYFVEYRGGFIVEFYNNNKLINTKYFSLNDGNLPCFLNIGKIEVSG